MQEAWLIVTLSVVVVGCATAYQPKGFTGGYEEVEVKPGVFFLEFEGNGYTSLPTVVQYWHRRADEVCARSGQVAEVLDTEQAMAVTGAVGNTYTMGRSTFGGATFVRKPSKSGYIRCVQH